MSERCELIPVRTRRFAPPCDTVTDELLTQLPRLAERDIVAVTSKVVAIEQGRALPRGTEAAKQALMRANSEYYLEERFIRYGVQLGIVHNAIIGSSGVDESNGDGFWILLPEAPSAWAAKFCTLLRGRDGLSELGVIVTDSRCMPLRLGVLGVAIGGAGFEPLHDYRGTKDLFGRSYRSSQANQADALAVAAGGVMGEGDECTPAVIIRGWPRLQFREGAQLEQLFVPPEEDLFAALLAGFIPGGSRIRTGENE